MRWSLAWMFLAMSTLLCDSHVAKKGLPTEASPSFVEAC
jgi:hypothetical protein